MPPSPDPQQGAGERSAYLDVRDDPGLRRVLVTARAWGVRPSEFLAWGSDDRELALALHDYEAEQCPGCGGQLGVTTDPEAEERFVPGPSIRCHRCTAISQSRETHKTTYHPHAVLHTARDRAIEPDLTDATGGADDDRTEDTEEDGDPPAAGGAVQDG